MPVYDSTFILNPQLEEGGLDTRIKEAIDLINATGGKLIKENRMGMRRMAYEIQKLTQGYYVSLVFEGDQGTITELERLFRLDESCLRFLTCHYQDFSRKRDRKVSSDNGVDASQIEDEVPADDDLGEDKDSDDLSKPEISDYETDDDQI